MTVTPSEAHVVANRIIKAHIPDPTFAGLNIDPAGFVTITVNDATVMQRVAVALKFQRQGALTNRWAGVWDDVHVSLCLGVPLGVFPVRQRGEALL